MTFHIVVFLLVVCLLLLLALLWPLDRFALEPPHSQVARRRTLVHRLLKPRTPLDCPSCRLACTPSPSVRPDPALVRPWGEVKSRRGAPKHVNTAGYACPNQQCTYFGVTEAQIHALVGDGKHGQVEQIQTLRCQACRTTFTSRRNTPLYRLKTPSHQVAMVLSSAFRRAGPIGGRTSLRLPAGHHHHVADARGLARSDVTQAVLLPSAPPTPAAGRAAHPAP